MKSTQYKKGVREIISCAQEINPLIGNYLQHQQSGTDHFQIALSNGTVTLPRQVAHSQQEFPAHVSNEWIAEIANTFESRASETGKSSGNFVLALFNKFLPSR